MCHPLRRNAPWTLDMVVRRGMGYAAIRWSLVRNKRGRLAVASRLPLRVGESCDVHTRVSTVGVLQARQFTFALLGQQSS